MLFRFEALLLGIVLVGACFSEPPNVPSDASGASGTESGGSESGVPGTGTGTTTFGPETTGSGGSSTGGPIPISCDGAEHVLYLAFGGFTLKDSNAGVDNAPSGVVADPRIAADYGPYLGMDRSSLLDAVRGHFEPFGLCVTDQEPGVLDYDLLVITSDTLGDGNILGWPALDCGNGSNNNVNVVFLSAMVEIGESKRAIAISKFAGGLYGLEDLAAPEPSDIMNRFVASTNNGATFTEPCHELSDSLCPPTPDCSSGQQSSARRLIAAFN